MPPPELMNALFFSLVICAMASATEEVGTSNTASTPSRSYHCRVIEAPTSGLFWWSAATTSTFNPCSSGLKSSTAMRAATTEPSPVESK